MPLRDRSGQRWQRLGKPYVVAATEVCSRFIGTCRDLSPLLPLPFPLSFFASWGFPECNTQDHPSLSLVCPWTLVRSWEHLPFSFSLLSLSLPLSFFLPFSLSFLPPWVSLDAFVIAGYLLLSSFGVSLDACVVAGNTFLSFLSFFSSLLTPPYCWDLSPLLPLPFPLSFFASWGFPECNTQDHLSLSLVCPWTLVRSWEHLPFSFFFSPLPFSPSLLLSFLLSLLWVSLDAFVIAGNLLLSSFGVSLDACVVAGNTFLSLLSFFSSLPTPPSCRHLSLGCY